MPIIFMKKGCRKSFQSCDYDFSEKVNLKEDTEQVHIKIRLNNSSISDHGYSQKSGTEKHLEFVHSKD